MNLPCEASENKFAFVPESICTGSAAPARDQIVLRGKVRELHTAPARAAVMVTDLVEFTTVIQQFGDRSAQRLLRQHDVIARATFDRHEGYCANHTGDGFVTGFRSPRAALSCAQELASAVQSIDTRLQLRIALHVGNPLLEHGRLFGLCVNTTFRVCASAEPGCILVTEPFRQACNCIPQELSRARTLRLKGIPEPLLVHTVA